MTDWAQVRAMRFSDERPPDWPDGVFAISFKGMALLGVHEKEGKLYWDGKEIVTKRIVRLGTWEFWMALVASASTFGYLLLEIGRSAGWWE